MTEHNEAGGHGEHGEIHLPDPSIWPLVVGAAALFLGLALVYWTRDRNSDFSGPMLGAALLAVLFSAFGWAYEDSRMKRKAEEGAHGGGPRNARYTQVLTFAVAEGRLTEARNGGVISAFERSDSALRDLNGFQDLRIIASQSLVGPSQVLVETTWSDREGLATYEETRGTLLDIVAAHPDDVASGSVQVFDMEVVRDTKDVSFRFGTKAALSILGSLVVGGFMVGAGLNLFASESEATEGGPAEPTAPTDPYLIVADNLKFSRDTLTAPPNTAVTFTLNNEDSAPHNIHFMNQQGGTTLAPGAEGEIIRGGETTTLSFTTPGPGSYYFLCDVHPQMNGTFIVAEGAPPPGGAPPAPGGAAGAPTGANAITATDNKFDKVKLTAKAGEEFTISLDNKGRTKHNISFYDKKGGQPLAPTAEGKLVDGGKSDVVKFTPATPGKYYFQCDLHPSDMSGELEVT